MDHGVRVGRGTDYLVIGKLVEVRPSMINWVILHGNLSSTDFFRMSKSLNQDQARYFVMPDLGPNCLQRLSADIKQAKS